MKLIIILLALIMYSCNNKCSKGHYETQLLPMAMVDANGQSSTILLPQKVWVCDTIKINK